MRVAYYNGDIWWWWLRSPGRVSDLAAYVDKGGCVCCRIGDHVNIADGVRPAFWLNS
ncbi:MAG: DUF6273 domain-containing protein [Lachnospiraceae bacterium]|nr:DUF6273 domain-containing protein [Lachnospiraceae bacterium]